MNRLRGVSYTAEMILYSNISMNIQQRFADILKIQKKYFFEFLSSIMSSIPIPHHEHLGQDMEEGLLHPGWHPVGCRRPEQQISA